ncbi:hypothetical protein [Stutzerimonas chloritidismutans]|uniref:hypothetical protein n=1 Tax=Stutzerimonas chloritidismutans TaxID=203192 RepID=UPI00384B84FC
MLMTLTPSRQDYRDGASGGIRSAILNHTHISHGGLAIAGKSVSARRVDFWVKYLLTEKSDKANFPRQSPEQKRPEARLDPVSSQSRTAP